MMSEFVANRHSLFAFIYGLVRNTHDAEDIFQEVWMRLSNSLSQGAAIEDQARWCRGTARNLILHYWRDRQNDKVVVDQELMELVDMAFEEQEGHSDYWLARQQALNECMNALPERSRHLLRLKYEMGVPAEQMAEELLQSVGAVQMALSRVRRLLRDCANKKLGIQGVAR